MTVRSFLAPETAYLYRLLLPMHRNPLRAKIVERLAISEAQYRDLPCSGGN